MKNIWLLLLLVILGFVWFEVRPMLIRQKCIRVATYDTPYNDMTYRFNENPSNWNFGAAEKMNLMNNYRWDEYNSCLAMYGYHE